MTVTDAVPDQDEMQIGGMGMGSLGIRRRGDTWCVWGTCSTFIFNLVMGV